MTLGNPTRAPFDVCRFKIRTLRTPQDFLFPIIATQHRLCQADKIGKERARASRGRTIRHGPALHKGTGQNDAPAAPRPAPVRHAGIGGHGDVVPVDLKGGQRRRGVRAERRVVKPDEGHVLRHALSRAAREAEQRKNELIVYLAHDLKTPLTSVIGYLTLLQDEPDLSPESRARFTGVALDKAGRLEELINEFFDITRFSLSSLTLDVERVNFSRMLEQIAFEFQPLLAEKNLEIDLQVPPDVQAALDPNKMERVLDNLLRNAAYYATPGTRILLALRAQSDGVQVLVQNRGKTIPKEKLDRIFERFFRLDESRSSNTGGAGLGLAIAKEIVEQHGGSISAASADGVISFTVSLPQPLPQANA